MGPKLADGRQSIVLVSDNNFGATQYTQILTLGADLVPTPIPVEATLTKSADNDVFTLKGGSGKPKLQVSLTGRNSNLVNELGVFAVDDATGKIDGIAPGATGYAEKALARGRVILSAISNVPNGFNPNEIGRSLEFADGNNVRFYLVKDSTTDSVISGKTPSSNVIFSSPTTQKVTDLTNSNFTLAFEDGSGAADFQDLVVKIEPSNQALPLGVGLQGKQEGEVLDLRGLSGNVKANFSVNREAAFNNLVGFYKVDDETGRIGNLKPSDAGYAQQAMRQRIAEIDLRVDNQGTAVFDNKQLAGGSILAPFMIANGATIDQVLNNQTNNVYFAYLGANSDKVDHIRLLGNNTFGFEDLASGGDFDYNDVIVRANLTV
ncbi:MAG: DUF4114 domain-containing protein [Cyanomargarita calcarea GSE-NOS-MK-12-04C]|uniref:DUF4114 domain-containing protein n=1 Tax=Cyanomargarita calcarea GSE-NOS-MK-12-04C TaxID=2839659 RepID=A0A951QSZ7_9CYAN|nr:DUF4114 domain-containing protein [Cyanomargarita calcarea GSE-NOS-MK-12-04C]